jgi:fucose permease
MYGDFGVPVSYAGIISMIIAAGTIVSSSQSDRLTRKLGTGKITALSVGLTALALFGFSTGHSFWALCLWAVPYGLGAGSVDAALNSYVALHYSSRHMSWLHCMWGVGASLSPYVMGYALTGGQGWSAGYGYISAMQVVLTVILIFSLPLWKKRAAANEAANNEATDNKAADNEAASNVAGKALSIKQIFKIAGAKEIMITFFCYCSLEQTAGLWGSSYLVLNRGITPEEAARFAGLFYIGITFGRAVSGFVTMVMNDKNMVRLGQILIFIGICAVIIPAGNDAAKAGLVIVGLGCAPIYPCIIHSTPEHFGAENSQAIIGIQMASAYIGTCLMPPVFGLIAQHISIAAFPVFLLLVLAVMVFMHEKMIAKSKNAQ